MPTPACAPGHFPENILAGQFADLEANRRRIVDISASPERCRRNCRRLALAAAPSQVVAVGFSASQRPGRWHCDGGLPPFLACAVSLSATRAGTLVRPEARSSLVCVTGPKRLVSQARTSCGCN